MNSFQLAAVKSRRTARRSRWRQRRTGAPELTHQDYTQRPSGQTVFGQALPAGVSIEQATQFYKDLGNVFSMDFMKLGHNVTDTQKCVKWFMDAMVNPPAKQQRQLHSYNLFEHTNDPLFQAFANYASGQRFSQKLITNACWWVTEAAKRLNAQSPGEGQGALPRTAPNSGSSEALLASLSDKDFNAVLRINELAQQRTFQTLANKHGEHMARSMVELAQKQLESLSPHERAHFDQFTTVAGQSWVHMMNCVETIEFLYQSHIGANSIGTNSGDINKEIRDFEAMLKIPSERAKYMKDPALQARLRELYSRRGG